MKGTSELIYSECNLVGWYSMADMSILRNIPFGIYTIMSPDKNEVLNPQVFPHDVKDTIYIGLAGKSSSDFHYDRKSEDRFYPQGAVYMRLKSHKAALTRRNALKSVDNTYKAFYDTYSWGKDVVDNVRIGILVPNSQIPEASIRPWLYHMESALIYAYTENFGKVPLMNLAHSSNVGSALINPESLAQKRKVELVSNNLRQFVDA